MQVTCTNGAAVKPFDLDEFLSAAEDAKRRPAPPPAPYEVTRAEYEALKRLGAPTLESADPQWQPVSLFGVKIVVKARIRGRAAGRCSWLVMISRPLPWPAPGLS